MKAWEYDGGPETHRGRTITSREQGVIFLFPFYAHEHQRWRLVLLAGDTTAVPTGAIEELMERAVKQGSVTPEEIAEIPDTEELPVKAETSWSVGGSQDRH